MSLGERVRREYYDECLNRGFPITTVGNDGVFGTVGNDWVFTNVGDDRVLKLSGMIVFIRGGGERWHLNQ